MVSPDGYLLTLYRITGNNDAVPACTRGPILLDHGSYDEGLSWMQRSVTDNIAYPVQLFEMGFDVWINNTRGTE